MPRRISTGILGGSGYTGVELLRLLSNHPSVEITAVTSRKAAGRPVSALFPSLRGFVDQPFEQPNPTQLAEQCELIFCATPHGVAMHEIPPMLDRGVRVIDLSADFRLTKPTLYKQWYGQPHTAPEWLKQTIYGLPEVNAEVLSEAQLVANPGCYPTAIQLGLLPLLEDQVVDPTSLLADVKSGISGGGREPKTNLLFAETNDSLSAYKVDGHRHLPEIEQGLSRAAGRAVELVFVPHLAPMIRGIHATLYGRLTDHSADLQHLYEQRFQGAPFVDVLPRGSHPDTRSVRGSNYCRIAIHRPTAGPWVVILSVIDNLVKGAAGQAIQNMNLMFGLPEEEGLQIPALLP